MTGQSHVAMQLIADGKVYATDWNMSMGEASRHNQILESYGSTMRWHAVVVIPTLPFRAMKPLSLKRAKELALKAKPPE